MRRRVIMTGTNGFIGSRLKNKITEMGYDVITIGKENWKQSLCDLWMSPTIRPGEVEAIFHLGANAAVSYNKFDIWEDNYHTTKKLMEFAKSYGVSKFIFSSTSALYGNGDMPVNHYGWTKLVSEDYGHSYLENSNTIFIALRYFNVFGPGERRKGDWSSLILQSYLNERRLKLFNDISRDYIHVEDVINANLYALRHLTSSGTFEVGTGISTTPADFVRYGGADISKFEVIKCPIENLQKYTCANPNKFMYGWKPLWTTEEGAKSYGEYIRNGSWEYDRI